MFVIDYMIIPADSLYAAYDFVAEPVLNAMRIAPAAIRNGIRPNATNEVLHSKINAIISPVNRVVRF